MSSFDVIDNLIRGKNPERMGLVDYPWEDTLAAWVEQGYPTHKKYKEKGWKRWRRSDGRWEDAAKAGEYEEPVPAWEHFGFDLAGAGLWFDILPIRDYEEMVEETDEWEIKRNGAGASLKYWKHKSGTPEHIDFRMTTREIWENDYRPYMIGDMDPQRFRIDESRESFNEVKDAQRWVHFGHMFVWENMRQSMGDVTLYESLLTDPAWIQDYNQVHTDFFQKAYTYMFNQVGVPNGIWIYEDLGYRNGLFASPRVLRELIFPYYKKMVDFFHERDLPVILHSCGSTAQALPLIIEAGFDALNPMERKAENNDPFLFAEKYGDKLAFIGGFDARIFESNDKDLVRKEMIQYIRGMKERGARLVFASDHSLSTNVRYETYRYAVDVFRDHCAY
jgi:uroporphyrinogen decarboxylase